MIVAMFKTADALVNLSRPQRCLCCYAPGETGASRMAPVASPTVCFVHKQVDTSGAL